MYSPSFELAHDAPGSPSPRGAASAPALLPAPPGPATSPPAAAAGPKPVLTSAMSDAAALAAAARLARMPTHAGEGVAEAMAGSCLPEAQKRLGGWGGVGGLLLWGVWAGLSCFGLALLLRVGGQGPRWSKRVQALRWAHCVGPWTPCL